MAVKPTCPFCNADITRSGVTSWRWHAMVTMYLILCNNCSKVLGAVRAE